MTSTSMVATSTPYGTPSRWEEPARCPPSASGSTIHRSGCSWRCSACSRTDRGRVHLQAIHFRTPDQTMRTKQPDVPERIRGGSFTPRDDRDRRVPQPVPECGRLRRSAQPGNRLSLPADRRPPAPVPLHGMGTPRRAAHPAAARDKPILPLVGPRQSCPGIVLPCIRARSTRPWRLGVEPRTRLLDDSDGRRRDRLRPRSGTGASRSSSAIRWGAASPCSQR